MFVVQDSHLTSFHSKKWYGNVESVAWRLCARGVEIQGSGIERTSGSPTTVSRIWARFGEHINEWAEYYCVPVPLIIATIATESGGDKDSYRFEPNLGEASVGLMQTLVSTAVDALKDNTISEEWLKFPRNSIKAGTKYIKDQKINTLFDPPYVASSYNSGGIYLNLSNSNRWKMKMFPIGTSKHVDRFIKWFNDSVYVLSQSDYKPACNYECMAQA